MKIVFRCVTLFVVLFLSGRCAYCQHTAAAYRLIAHRGGVVDSVRQENSLEALQEAVNRGYYMIEVDLRMTSDSLLVTHHDESLKRTFGVDKPVSGLTWKEISALRGPTGYRVLLFEEVLKNAQGHLQIMIDFKIRGNHPAVFDHVIGLLKKYDLYKDALMIGTDESTPFFTGKVKQSCTRRQLEDNMQKPGYSSGNYYLFSGDISAADAAWAKRHNILAVGVVNAWAFKEQEGLKPARQQAKRLLEAGVTWFQIDSVFEPFFK
jgi:glycerophosphoryl diester phosphodiesterase